MKRKRKSPIRHKVRQHTRKNKPVREYGRGRGQNQVPITKRRLSKTTTGPKPFTVNFKYSDKKGDGESVVVISRTYEKALAEAYEEKRDNRNPISIEIIDPDFGRVLKLIGTGVRKLGSIGAKYAVKGGHIAKRAAIKAGKVAVAGVKSTGKKAGERMAKRSHSKRARKLVTQSYSEDRGRRYVARSQLKHEFPDVYDVCDFSKT